MWLLYEVLLIIGFLLYVPGAVLRGRLPHRKWRMRLGRYPDEVTQRLAGGQTIWIHAVSVGEAIAARPLITALSKTYPNYTVVLSTITPSGFSVAAQQVGERGIAIYFPLDLRVCVTRALDVLKPRILLLMESEFWPVMLHLAKARKIPIALVNGRTSARAFRRYQLVRPFVARMLGHVDCFLMQSQVDAERVIAMGAPAKRVSVAGNLKWDASLSARPATATLQTSAARLGLRNGDTVIVAGSTHPGEEETVLTAFKALRRPDRPLRLIIAPRHMERLPEVEELIRRSRLRVARLSQVLTTVPWEVGLVDTFGELAQYYGLATIAFIGGSLIPHGGQNPLEPASLGKPVLFGPFMHNFPDIVRELLEHRAARQLTGVGELTVALKELLDNRAVASEMGRRAQALTEERSGATRRILESIKPLLTASSSST